MVLAKDILLFYETGIPYRPPSKLNPSENQWLRLSEVFKLMKPQNVFFALISRDAARTASLLLPGIRFYLHKVLHPCSNTGP